MFDKENVNRFDDHVNAVSLLEGQFVERFKRHYGGQVGPGGNLDFDETHQFPLFYIRDSPRNSISCAYSHRGISKSRAILLEGAPCVPSLRLYIKTKGNPFTLL